MIGRPRLATMAWRAGVVALLLALVGGCATAPPPADALSGRLSVRVEGSEPRSVNASFDLRGNATRGELALSTPLGTTMAQARWQPGDVRLLTSDGEQRFPDLETLTRDVIGEPLPLAALFDWLRGRPWPQAPSTPLTDGTNGFVQLGWRVDLARFAEGWVGARRGEPAPQVTLRARLDGAR